MKKRKETPRMLTYVVQAVTDLKDINGSTMRRIIDQVHTAIDVANVKPKPRNVVMQVKKALKHAVDTGVLRHRAGKYRLEFPTDKNARVRSLRPRGHRRLKKKRKQSRRTRHRPRRKLVRHRYSTSATSVASTPSFSSTSYMGDSYATDIEKKSRSVRRRRRSAARKRVQICREATRGKQKRGMRRPRRQTPMPTAETKIEDVYPSPEIANPTEVFKNLANTFVTEMADQIEMLENIFANNPKEELANPIEDIENVENVENTIVTSPEMANRIEMFENIFANTPKEELLGCQDYEPLTIEEIPPECDNPECLCNLKQEPCEENNYDVHSDINMDTSSIINDDNTNDSQNSN